MRQTLFPFDTILLNKINPHDGRFNCKLSFLTESALQCLTVHKKTPASLANGDQYHVSGIFLLSKILSLNKDDFFFLSKFIENSTNRLLYENEIFQEVLEKLGKFFDIFMFKPTAKMYLCDDLNKKSKINLKICRWLFVTTVLPFTKKMRSFFSIQITSLSPRMHKYLYNNIE